MPILCSSVSLYLSIYLSLFCGVSPPFVSSEETPFQRGVRVDKRAMSEELLTQWKNRVLTTEAAVGREQKLINTALEMQRSFKQEGHKLAETIEKEKHDLLKELEAVEAEAKKLSDLCERTLTEKDRVEAIYTNTLDEYEKMHYLVYDIKGEEERLASREDLETRLQRESLAWAEEEHALRSKLNGMQLQLKQTRKRQQQEIADLEADLAALEKRLRQERQDRGGEVRQQARTAVRGSRQVTPVPSSSTSTSMMNPNAGKETAFVAANASGAIPTRGAGLRSCLKTSAMGGGTGTASAPVSRAGSRSLVGDVSAVDGGDAPLPPSLPATARGSSYVSGKGLSRKRDVFGESTNQQ